MPREVKYHIYGNDGFPLRWGDKALEFKNEHDALEFLASAISCCDQDCRDMYDNAHVKSGILYYDGEDIDASDYIVRIDEETGEEWLVNKYKNE